PATSHPLSLHDALPIYALGHAEALGRGRLQLPHERPVGEHAPLVGGGEPRGHALEGRRRGPEERQPLGEGRLPAQQREVGHYRLLVDHGARTAIPGPLVNIVVATGTPAGAGERRSTRWANPLRATGAGAGRSAAWCGRRPATRWAQTDSSVLSARSNVPHARAMASASAPVSPSASARRRAAAAS